MASKHKSGERVQKLFKDIKRLADQPIEPVPETPSDQAIKPFVNQSELDGQIADLKARIRELEAQLEKNQHNRDTRPLAAAPLLYEEEQLGYAFSDNTLETLSSAELPPVDPNSSVTIPLQSSGETLGKMQLAAPSQKKWTVDDMDLANTVVQQVSLQIQNLRLLAATERARAEAEAATHRFTHENWEAFLDGIHQKEQLGYVYDQASVEPFDGTVPDQHDYAETVKVLDEQVGKLLLKADPAHPLSEEDKVLVTAVARQLGQQVESLRLLADAARARATAEEATRRLTHESWQAYTSKQDQETLGFVYDANQVLPLKDKALPVKKADLTQPLTVRGQTIGQLIVAEPKELSGEAAELAAAIAERAGVQIESLRLSEELQKRAFELATVAQVSATISTTLDPDQLVQTVVDLTKAYFQIYHAQIYLADESWNMLLLAAGAGETGKRMVSEQHAIPMDSKKSLVARTVRERKALIINNVHAEEDFLPNPYLPDTLSEMAIPMASGDKVLGVFDIQSDLLNFFTQEDANIYTTLATQVAIALQNARLYVEQAATVTQLRELDRLKSSFLANMSHELRTPLNSILGFSDVMLEELDGPLTPNMENDLGLIQKNGKHLLHLINDVLDMAKIESGKMNLLIEKFNLNEIIEEVTSITSPLASEKNLALFIEPDSDRDVEINADKIRLRQVLINIINNAIKFTEQGKISIMTTREGSQVLVTIKDTGIGIPPEQLESVFQEFTQVDISTTRKVGGTGLGLPISRRLIELHGGKLWVESTGVNGEGSTFYISMPIEAKVQEPESEKK